jgi:hypothetical protein
MLINFFKKIRNKKSERIIFVKKTTLEKKNTLYFKFILKNAK